MRFGGCLKFITVLILAGAFTPDARAQEPFRGKTVQIVVGFSTGGTYDQQARLFARHLGQYLPGIPTVVVQNMPGAGSIIATTYLYNIAPKDGTVIAIVGGSVVPEPLLGNPQARYDARRFNWIGGRTTDNFLCLINRSTGVRNIDDLRQRETTVGATGPGSRTRNYPRAMNMLFGTKFKVVSGYPGGTEISIALERGEVEGYCGWSWDSLRSRAPALLPEGKVVAVAQFLIGKANALPGIPMASDLATSDTDRRAIEFISADSILAWPFVAPPGMDASVVAAHRLAFDNVTKNESFLADAKQMSLDVAPVSGEALQNFVNQLYDASPDVIALVSKITQN